MWFLPFSALWYVKGRWTIQPIKLSEIKHEARRRIFFFASRFEIQYKEADVDCFKGFDYREGWSCFIDAEANNRTCERVWFKKTVWKQSFRTSCISAAVKEEINNAPKIEVVLKISSVFAESRHLT